MTSFIRSFALSFSLIIQMGTWVYPASPTLPTINPYISNNFSLRSQCWGVSSSPASGMVYFATSDGLIEFNGISFTRFTLPFNRPVRSVLTHDNRIYTGTFEDFGYWSPDEQGRLRYHSLCRELEVEKNDEIWKIIEHEGSIYFQSFTTLYQYKDAQVTVFKAPYTMLFMHQVHNRLLVQILDSGLYWFEAGEFKKVENSDRIAAEKVHAIIEYNEHSLLICTEKAGLYLYDGTTFSTFKGEASDFLKQYSCNGALKINDSTFVFGSILNGIIFSDHKGNIEFAANTSNGLNNNTVLSLYLDHHNGLWAGLDDGVSYINLMSPFMQYKTDSGTLGTIYALLEKNNILYIGTNHGLFMADISRNAQRYSFSNLRLVAHSQGQVWSLEEIDGQIICGHNEGTFLVKGNELEKISAITGGWSFIEHNDYMLGGTYTGITVYDKDLNGKWKFRHRVSGFNEPSRYIETDYLGYLWASHHHQGVFKIELSDDLSKAIKVEHITDIHDKSLKISVFKINNRIVFATGDNIYTWDFVRNEIVAFETLTNYLGEYALASQIIPYRKNQYWFLLNGKMALFDISLEFKAQKVMELQLNNINLPLRKIPMVELDEDVLLMPNQQNFDVINLSLAPGIDTIGRLEINSLLFYGKNNRKWIPGNEKIKISPMYKNLTVYFADPTDFSRYPKTYSYRIREIDTSWQTTTADHFTYLDLKHGSYTIEVMREGTDVATASFVIRKPWYISYVALTVYTLVVLALIWAGVMFFSYEIRKHKEMLAMEVKQHSLEKELDYKSYELMLTMRHLMLKDNILTDLNKQIEAIREQASRYPVKHVKIMEKIIQQGLGTQSVEWENAMNNLKLSQQGFFRALKDKYPVLTPNDLKLCSYLRMNFNSKEIAHLMNISIRGVEVSRHRLRKKLQLPHDANLVEFLMSEENDLVER
jgi:DNA-binding CsgD family transcriptional regulator